MCVIFGIVQVDRFKLKRKSQQESDGETIMLCTASLRPDHASKLLFGFRYQFLQQNGTEKLMVIEAFNEK
jgi:hypothetical protein